LTQISFECKEEAGPGERSAVALERETAQTMIALMARALIAVVRAIEEADDER
jgi:hypothetical protein